MNTVVNKLLDVDRDARRKIDEAQQYHDKTMEEIEAEKKKMISYYEEKERQRLEDVQNVEEANVYHDTVKIKEKYSALTEKLNSSFASLSGTWENELFERCIKP